MTVGKHGALGDIDGAAWSKSTESTARGADPKVAFAILGDGANAAGLKAGGVVPAP
jgi:hypothetical protein